MERDMVIKTVDTETLKQWIDSGEAVIVDVREPAEHNAESIANSTLVPVGEISKSKLPAIREKKLVIHCRSGKRGITACEKLLAEDPNLEVYNLEGGISAWAGSGHAVKTSGKFFLLLDQQVQLTIGLSVLVGSMLAYFINPLFTILTGFFGAGLTFAGATGYCGLAMIMAKMPWNQSNDNKTSCAIK